MARIALRYITLQNFDVHGANRTHGTESEMALSRLLIAARGSLAALLPGRKAVLASATGAQ
jgi:hypothetical protein